MKIEKVKQQLLELLHKKVDAEVIRWLLEKVDLIITSKSTKDLYLTYTLLAAKIKERHFIGLDDNESELGAFLVSHKANTLELSRIFLLIEVLEADEYFFTDKVDKLTQVADTTELETFLKYLFLLPNAGAYKNTAVDALRTNIVTVFDAISLDNPYPAAHFNNQQWNQMYLKAAFLQGNLTGILDIDKRANSDLARIVSDYAHERWAASREIDAAIWQPTTNFLEGVLLEDMSRLFKSVNSAERKAASLCCFYSKNKGTKELLVTYPEYNKEIENNQIHWKNIKE